MQHQLMCSRVYKLRPIPDIGQVEGLDVGSLQVKGALVEVVQPLDDLDHSRLATTGLTNQGNLLPSLDGQVQPVEHLGGCHHHHNHHHPHTIIIIIVDNILRVPMQM